MKLSLETLESMTKNLIHDTQYHELIMWGGGYGKPGWKDGDPIDMDYIKQTQAQWLQYLATMKTHAEVASTPPACDGNEP